MYKHLIHSWNILFLYNSLGPEEFDASFDLFCWLISIRIPDADVVHLQARAREPQELEQEVGVRAGVSDQSTGRRGTGVGSEAARSTRGQVGVETLAAGVEAAGVRNTDQ